MTIKVILGVSQRDFYNYNFFEKVSLMKDSPLKVFVVGRIEYVGVEVALDNQGRATKKAMADALKVYQENAFSKLKELSPIFYTLEV